MDSNHDKQNQNLLCYRYTTGQSCANRTGEQHSRNGGGSRWGRPLAVRANPRGPAPVQTANPAWLVYPLRLPRSLSTNAPFRGTNHGRAGGPNVKATLKAVPKRNAAPEIRPSWALAVTLSTWTMDGCARGDESPRVAHHGRVCDSRTACPSSVRVPWSKNVCPRVS